MFVIDYADVSVHIHCYVFVHALCGHVYVVCVCSGDLLKGWLRCHKNRQDPRALVITIKYELHSFTNTDKIVAEQTYLME